MPYCIIDLETTIKSSYKRVANPFDKDNRITMLGYKLEGQESIIQTNKIDLSFLDHCTVLIGQNIKFDLLYLWDYPRLQNWIAKGGKIFDTMIAEYILEAQTPKAHRGLSLDVIAVKYGGTSKNRISKLIKGGKCTSYLLEHYPKMMHKYLIGDLVNTEIVALAQLSRLRGSNRLKLAKLIMESVLTTTEMEYNGLYVDQNNLKQLSILNTNKLSTLRNNFFELLCSLKNDWPLHVDLNINSNDHISLLFFGGEIKYTSLQPKLDSDGQQIFIKTGKSAGEPKLQSIITSVKVKALIQSTKNTTKPVKKAGFYAVNEPVLQTISKFAGTPGKLATMLLEQRTLQKELSTYCDGLSELIQSDGLIHHQLNQAVTHTGRLSSSTPNGQNIPKKSYSKVKKIFSSRFGEDGVIMEADFKQLEVVVAAFLSQDLILINELNSGRDMHFDNAKWLYHKEDISAEERGRTKEITFQLIYGASAYAMAKSTNLDQNDCQRFIDRFYDKYSTFAEWHKELVAEVLSNRHLSTDGTTYEANFESITGRIYRFKEILKYDGSLALNLPDIKNYPVQGLATGDIVPIQLGRLYRALLTHKSTIRVVNTVHDSVLLDVHKNSTDLARQICKDVLQCMDWFKPLTGIDFNLNLTVDIKHGQTWWDL